MEKRGQIIYKALVVIIGSALIIAGFLQAGKSYGSQEAFYKLAIAKDLALTIDLLYALPGDLEYTYPNDVSGYIIEVKGNTVKVSTGNQDKTFGLYIFVGINQDMINAEIKNQKFVKLEKINNKIRITGVTDQFFSFSGGSTGGGGAGG